MIRSLVPCMKNSLKRHIKTVNIISTSKLC
nr:MAG TPA_asm: hypothetical protein [Caudoviricetes sp.]